MEDLTNQEMDAFKSRLVNDVFSKDNKGKVPMEKVMMLIWQFRDDPTVVRFMAQFVAKYAGARDVFDGIEFYLPQLAHMIIHLEANWDDAILERFALVIAQRSLHFALQLNWILQGAIDDYQPELPNGEPNPQYHPLYFSRCIKLRNNMERCVVYGSPLNPKIQRLYEKGDISKEEYETLEQSDRSFNAVHVMQQHKDVVPDRGGHDGMDFTFTGELKYKRHKRTGRFKSKKWKTRYFAVSQGMLYCYNYKGGKLNRAMPLEGATVSIITNDDTTTTKYPHVLQVQNLDFHFTMRASSDMDRDQWVQVLQRESQSSSLYPIHNNGSSNNSNAQQQQQHLSQKLMEDMTPSQRARYEFFQKERQFIRDMCQVAEELRFEDRDQRKKLAPGLVKAMNIPACVYVPMCYSTDTWRRVFKTLPQETRVFNTKERCPVIMYFQTTRGGETIIHNKFKRPSLPNLDVAHYLHHQYQIDEEQPPLTTTTTNNNNNNNNNSNSNNTSTSLPIMTVIEEQNENNLEEESCQLEVVTTILPQQEQPPPTTTSTTPFIMEEEATKIASGTKLWREYSITSPKENTNNTTHRGNSQLQNFLKGNINLPTKLGNILRNNIISRSRRTVNQTSFLDTNALPMFDTVPIVDSQVSVSEDNDDSSIVSDVSSSILTHEGILHVDEERDGISKECLERAKHAICGGETYAEKTERMLRKIEKEEQQTTTTTTTTLDEEHDNIVEVYGIMVKSNDDLRQEVFVMQMIHFYKSVFAKAHLPIWLKTYRILSTSKDCGLIEVLTDATSIDGLKKSDTYPKVGGLRAYFEQTYGSPETPTFIAAQRNFMLSLVGYSIVSYLLGLKDRHNGNIMIDMRGHLIFIDFGFAMGMAPGHECSMERAAFKLTQDYMDVMDGIDSECFAEFERMFVKGFQAARANSQIALGLVEIMMYKSNYPCFSGHRYGGHKAIQSFEERLMLRTPDDQVPQKAQQLVTNAINHWGTRFYDKFQKWTNGYSI